MASFEFNQGLSIGILIGSSLNIKAPTEVVPTPHEWYGCANTNNYTYCWKCVMWGSVWVFYSDKPMYILLVYWSYIVYFGECNCEFYGDDGETYYHPTKLYGKTDQISSIDDIHSYEGNYNLKSDKLILFNATI